jgi:glycosyltransferase involved in cell wall biosynthesis
MTNGDCSVTRMRILAFADYYLPGFKAGGPIRALANLVDAFEGEIEFHIVTREYDLGGQRYEGVVRDRWHQVGPARVRYVGAAGVPRAELKRMLTDQAYDAVYLNSFFSPLSRAVIRERRLASGDVLPLIVAPRGELSPAALKLKGVRKQAYMSVVKRIGALRGIVWQASSAHEADHMASVLGDQVRPSIVVTEEIPSRAPAVSAREAKRAGSATLTFLSRICRMKNLDTAIEVLRDVRGKVGLAVYGPIEDREYWDECRRTAAGLPANIEFSYQGVVPYDGVAEVIGKSDLFFLPTRGENYGHVIVEALAAGCPVLVSDRTRWRDLEAHGVGWDVALDDTAKFRAAIERVVEMDESEHSGMRQRAVDYASAVADDKAIIERNRYLFQSAGRRSGPANSLPGTANVLTGVGHTAGSRDIQ